MRKLRLLAVLLAFALVALACGDTDEAPTTTTGVVTTTTAAPGSVEVLWIRGSDHPEGEAFIAVLDAFTAATGINVNYTGVGDALPTILSTRVGVGDPPDVAMIAQPGLLKDLATLGALVDIEGAVGSIVDANYAPIWRELGSVDGTLHGVWFKATNKSTVFYDVKAFDDLGVTPPATWDEWIALSRNLVDNGVTPMSIGGADGWVLSDFFENVLLRTAGAETYNQLANNEIPWTDPAVEAAFARMGEILGMDDFIAGGAAGTLQTGFVDSVTQVFAAGDAAMVFEGDFVGGVAAGETDAAPVTDFNFFDFPSIDGSPPTVVYSGDVVVAFNERPETLALIAYMASPQSAEVWIPRGGFNSPNKAIDLSLFPDEVTRRAAESFGNAEVSAFDLSDLVPAALGQTGGAGIWGQLQAWLEAPENVDAVLAQLEEEAVAAFE